MLEGQEVDTLLFEFEILLVDLVVALCDQSGERLVSLTETQIVASYHPIAGIQAVEYLRAFLFGRLGLNRLGGNLVVSGDFGLFLDWRLIAIFTLVGVGGSMVGGRIAPRISQVALRRGFAAFLVIVGAFIVWENAPMVF